MMGLMMGRVDDEKQKPSITAAYKVMDRGRYIRDLLRDIRISCAA